MQSSSRRHARAESGPPPRAPGRPDGGASILVAEDEAAVRSLLVRVLRAQGYSVTEAADGTAALALAEAKPEPFSLLLTDVLMPRLSGPELVRCLRAGGRALRVIYITGYAEALIDVQEADIVLRKPFSPRTLTETVRRALAPEGDPPRHSGRVE